jgi:PIN domain nuclease of toxin-antitoxin system
MKLLLDTHIALSIMECSLALKFPQFVAAIRSPETLNRVSVVSLWEIAIKVRLGKLESRVPLSEMANMLKRQNVSILMMKSDHAVAEVLPEPMTRDPFDRLLVAQAQIEGMRFVTIDRALADHPVTFR